MSFEDREVPAPQKNGAIALVVPEALAPLGIDQTKWEVITQQVFPAAKDSNVIALAVKYCHARGLDVLKKPVHIVPMWDDIKKKYVDTIWPGINELLVTASRTGVFAGKDEAVFAEDKEIKFATLTIKVPQSATCTVYKLVHGIRCPFTETVYYTEKVALKKGDPNKMWQRSPRQQLAKCALAAALRVAFPEEIGMSFAAEEMEDQDLEPNLREVDEQTQAVINKAGQVKSTKEQKKKAVTESPQAQKVEAAKATVEEATVVEEVTPTPPEPVTGTTEAPDRAQMDHLKAIAAASGWAPDQLVNWAMKKWDIKVENWKSQFTMDKYNQTLDHVQANKPQV